MSKLPTPLLSHPQLSQWLSFSKPGVIVVKSGRVELGQGVSAAIVSIAADEFQIDKEHIKLLSGDTEFCPNEGFTAGSASISVGGMCVRIVSRIAFNRLKDQAATTLQASVDKIDIVEGSVLHDGLDTGLTLWEQAEAVNWDYSIPVDYVDNLTGTDTYPSNVKQSYPPNNLITRLSGQEFIHDLELPGMLHARVVSPLNYCDRLSQSIAQLSKQLPAQVSLLSRSSFLAVVSDREEMVVAAANKLHALSIWSGEDKSRRSSVNTHPLDGFASDKCIDYHSVSDVAHPISATTSVQIERPCLSHASIGPGCALAHFNEHKLTVWSHSQGVFQLRAAIASMLEIAQSTVRVIHMPGAGCYGHNSADDVAADAAIAAMLKPGIPIRMQYSRADEFQKSPLGPAMRTACTAELDAQNNLARVQLNIISPEHSSRPGTRGAINLRSAMLIQASRPPDEHQSVADYESYLIKTGEPVLKVGGGCNRNAVPAYRIPDVEVVVNRLSALPYRVSALRGLGAFVNVLSIEAMMDECAANNASVNPVDYRLQHLDDPRAKAVIQQVARLADYDNNDAVGIGYARYKNTAAYCACMALVSINEEIKVERMWIVADAGENINPGGIMAQLEGGAIQAMSWLLHEEAPIAENATSISDWDNYPIARFSHVPELHVELLEPDAVPALGCGEASQGPAAAAIYNAACRLLGARPTQLPLSRSGLMRQLLS